LDRPNNNNIAHLLFCGTSCNALSTKRSMARKEYQRRTYNTSLLTFLFLLFPFISYARKSTTP
jgi:hypothetical protein